MTLRPLLLLSLFGSAFAGPAAAGAAAPRPAAAPLCVPAPSSTGASEYRCGYDGAALNARVLDLLNLRSPGLTVEAVERTFGLPPMTASSADPWTADYLVLLRSGPDGGGPRLLVNLRESFGPGVTGRRHRLRGTDRPVRIDPRIRGEMILDLTLFAPETSLAAGPVCPAPEALAAAAVSRGWRHGGRQPVYMSHGPPVWELELKRGRLSLRTDITHAPACARNLKIRQESNAPPEPELPALRAAERRREIARAADGMAAAVARPGHPEEDPDALRAYAAFVRDGYTRFQTMDGNPNRDIDRQIAAMDEAEVRALASRLAGGHPWGAAREDCEAAIREADPVAALERRARRRGLGEPERVALRTQCHAFLEGRRFRYRPPPAEPAAPRN